jgi:integrase
MLLRLTVAVLVEHRDRCQARADVLGFSLDKDAFVFSSEIDGSRFLAPSSLTQRYDRLAARLDIETTFHKLAVLLGHRTDRDRRGRADGCRPTRHGGGGTTTLRAHTAWVSEADQRAAKNIGGRIPERPPQLDPVERVKSERRSPYERIDGQHGVSSGTAHRAMELLRNRGSFPSAAAVGQSLFALQNDRRT